MQSVKRAGGAAALTLLAALAGMALQSLFVSQLIADSRTSIASVAGLVTLVLALVLGLLVWTSYGVFSTQMSENQALGGSIIQLDFALERYGPEAAPGRRLLKAEVLRARDRFFGDANHGPKAFTNAQSRADMHEMNSFFATLSPTNEDQRDRLAAAKQLAATIVQTEMLMWRQIANPVPSLLFYTVLSWMVLLFFSFGFLAVINVLTIFAVALGAIAVSSAIFLVLELSEPYSGLFRIKSRGIDLLIGSLID
jgi:hypothetical protein